MRVGTVGRQALSSKLAAAVARETKDERAWNGGELQCTITRIGLKGKGFIKWIRCMHGQLELVIHVPTQVPNLALWLCIVALHHNVNTLQLLSHSSLELCTSY